jgi:hypothetical protein
MDNLGTGADPKGSVEHTLGITGVVVNANKKWPGETNIWVTHSKSLV